MKNNRYLFLSFVTVLAVVAVLFRFGYILNFDYKNLLANVANIDVSSLKAWQQNSGFNKKLSLNDRNADVKLLQEALSTDEEIYPEKTVSGFFGERTKKALTVFQKENNLSATGVFDKQTRDVLNGIFFGELCPVQTVEYPDFTDAVLSKVSKLPDDFIPKDLVDIRGTGVKSIGGVICLRSDALYSLKNMFDDAKKDKLTFAVSSGFRKPAIQQWLVDYYVKNFGEEKLNAIAQPGFSEHQLGTTVDLTGGSIGFRSTNSGFAKSKEYKWLLLNAGNYGFKLSYPVGNTEYIFEPWHWRFWGLEN